MTIITQLKSLYEQKQFYQALDLLNAEISRLKSLRFTELKKELEKVESADDFKFLLKCTDHFLMYNYSAFLVRNAYRRFPNLLTASWFCEELLDNGKPFEAEDMITKAISECTMNIYENESLERAYFSKIRCLLEMKRFKEVEDLLEKLKESPRPIEDKLGFIYLQMGNRDKAEEYLRIGLDDKERGRYCHLLLSDLYSSNGHFEKALKLIEEGEKRFPETPVFKLEKVKRLRDLGKPKEMLDIIQHLNERIPGHVYQKYFQHLTERACYQLEDFTKLETLIQSERRRTSLFIRKKEDGELTKLNIRPIVQKSNYCVPASLEMILSYYGMNMTQDEIAGHIFDLTGSRLSTTVDYLEGLGFTCRYFIGNKDLYIKLLKRDIPILLSVDFEHSSHVQVMTGYDSRFDFYHIQDPNILEGIYMSSEDLQKANLVTSYMSIVAVPKEKAAEISFLSSEEDSYFRTLHDLGEKMEGDEAKFKEPFFQFLQENIAIPYSPIYVIKHFSFEEYAEFIKDCAEKLLQQYPDNDFFNLHVAQAYMRLSSMERSEEQLAKTTRKTFSPLYHFLKGRIALYYDKNTEAVTHLRNSLQLDPDQYYTWSYLALAYLYQNDIAHAEFFSNISLQHAPDDRFVRVNHAAVLIGREDYANARQLYNSLIKEAPKDAHAWYERARLDQKMGKLRKALRGFLMTIKLDKEVPYAFLAAADLYEYEFDQVEKAKEILQSGTKTANSSQIYVRLGDLYKEQQEWENAANAYQTCINLNPDERFAYLGMAETIADEDTGKAVQYLKSHAKHFEQDSEFLINGAGILADLAKEEENSLPLLEEALTLFENGMNYIHSNLYDALEMYVGMVEGTPLIERAINFLREKSTKYPGMIELKCFLGTLHEEKHHYSLAIEAYKSALQMKEDSFPYFRLGEVYYQMNKLQLAEDAYKKCLELDSKVDLAYVRLAELASIQDDQDKEADYLLRLLEIAPMSVNVEYVTSILDEKGLLELVNKLLNLQGSYPKAWRLDMLAYTYGALANVKEEERCLTEALELEPEQPELLHHQAKLVIKQKKWEKASILLKHLLNKYKEDEDLYQTLIQLIAASNRWSKLEDFLYQFEGTNEEKSTLQMLAAEAVGQYFREIVLIDEEEGNLFTRFLRKTKNRMKQIRIFGTAISLFENAIKMDKDNLYLVSSFAKFYEDFDLVDDAVKILQNALSSEWDDRIGYQLGMLYLHEKKYKAALPLFEKCISNDPDNTHLKIQLSITLSYLHENEKALEIVEDILEYEDENLLAHYNKACYLALLNRTNEAQQVLDYVLENDETEYFHQLAATDDDLAKLKIG